MALSVGEVALDVVVGKNEITGAGGFLGKLGGFAKTAGLAIAAGVGVGIAALATLGKASVSAYASYEQLVGGVETLFKDNADAVIANSERAYMTAGMSANQYMETVTSFSASLLQSLGGDTVAAAAYADMAIIDMSDNANKLGTSIDMIQNAYQGFAKQNYTMLDNLKLGYGGTKAEMERLLADAQAISGIEYDISSYADVVEAIHVIQTEMGIAGTTAKEASSTIQGSILSMGAAWKNLLVGLADPTQNFDKLVTNFVDSVGTVLENLIPRITNALNGIVKLVTKLAPIIVSELPKLIQTILPPLLEGVVALATAIVEALPGMVQMIMEMLPTLLPMLITELINLVVLLCTNFAQIIQPILDNLPQIVMSIVDALVTNLPTLIQGAVTLVVGLVNALPQIILMLINHLPTIMVSIVDGLLKALPVLIVGVGQIIESVISAVWELLSSFPEAIGNFTKTIWDNILDIISNVWNGIKNIISNTINSIKNSISNAFNNIKNVITNTFNSIKNTAVSIWSAVKTAITNPVETAKTVVSTVVNSIKTTISNGFNAAKSTVSSIFDSIKSKISSVMDGAISVVSSAISRIRSFFNFSWKLPHIALPHFNISGRFSLNPPQIPYFSVSWYKKAMDDGMILNSPTIFGMSKNGQFLGGGEAGSETVVGTNSLLNMIKSTVASAVVAPKLDNVRVGTGESSSKIDELIELIKALLDKDDDDPTPIPIYIGNELIDEYILNKNSRQVLRSGGRA